ncbi:MAG: dihydroorotate dehydrogenase [Thermodesulfobacteriota bacterium]|nr:dihydroorotate dehydrogenase [Thermodesulfobacteriota bacterium]
MQSDINLKLDIAGIKMKNPIMIASGIFGYGRDYLKIEDFKNEDTGAIILKGTTLNPREGNPQPRIVETPFGLLNSIGLQNPGIDAVINEYLPGLKEFSTNKIINIAGFSVEEFGEMAKKLDGHEQIQGIEVNISCPNVKEGGIQFGIEPNLSYKVLNIVSKNTSLPIIAKLSPDARDIKEIAVACIEGGANALSLINTVPGIAVDIYKRRPMLGNNVGGLSGPAVKPIALLKVHETYQIAKKYNIPIIGMGGIVCAEDILEFIITGAKAVALGTMLFVYHKTIQEILIDLKNLLKKMNISDINHIVGTLTLNRS